VCPLNNFLQKHISVAQDWPDFPRDQLQKNGVKTSYSEAIVAEKIKNAYFSLAMIILHMHHDQDSTQHQHPNSKYFFQVTDGL